MFKYVLSLSFAVSCASARTISVEASCPGVVTTGPQFASCSGNLGSAQADVSGGDLVFDDSVLIGASAGVGGSGSSSATFADDYVFTITGGTGAGFFVPCMTAVTDDFVVGSVANVSFGSASLSPPLNRGLTAGTCNLGNLEPGTPIPFIFGVPQTYTATASAGASGMFFGSGDSSADLLGFQFFDGSGNQLMSVDFTLVSTSVPEPSAVSLLSIGWLFFVVLRRIFA